MHKSIPALDSRTLIQLEYINFLAQLKEAGFKGDIQQSYGSRVLYSTDNSVYQKLPQAIVLPANIDDLFLLGKLAARHQHSGIRFSPRGGGTGTNGQSLTDGLIVDTSLHMNQILEINTREKWVRVQAGVVKDQLNDFLRPYGYFFAPDLSTSNRATIGGMINTDASGQGSLVYGKTSDHVLGLKSVLVDGTLFETSPLTVEEAKKRISDGGIKSRILAQLIETGIGKRKKIVKKFPRLNRFLTGYDLEHILNDELDVLDPSRILCGSEGTLAFIAEATLNITPIPNHKVLLNIKYDSFESALRHAPQMVAAKATSVETIDSKVLNLAREDIIWHSVKSLIKEVSGKDILGLNMVEYNSNDENDIEEKVHALQCRLNTEIENGANGIIGYEVTRDTGQINKIYAMRKKAVGLLGKTRSKAKPVAFAEDTAVPPENLADFILAFRRLLDNKGLHYGMFGHVDAGVLHVRPALDLCDPQQEALLREISDDVVRLVAQYGGLMWGEHGKGYRSEYGPAFFGDELFNELRKIKTAFDPENKMNPGKICTPLAGDETLVNIDDEKRGRYDREIPVATRDAFQTVMDCNGNGLCFNYDTNSPMCPSFKATGDRRFSPKGRASMLKEWLRLLAEHDLQAEMLEQKSGSTSWYTRYRNKLHSPDDFSHEVLESMEECLACKACSTQCPVKVDVPAFRARFLNFYYHRYNRPLKDYLVAGVETMTPWLAKIPRVVNRLMTSMPVKNLLENRIGYVDAPELSVPTLKQRISEKYLFDFSKVEEIGPDERENTVLLVQDPFTSYYEAELITDTLQLLEKLGFKPHLLPFKPNGKPQHVKGFTNAFRDTAAASAAFLNKIAETGLPMVGLDPSLVLCYRDEYTKALGDKRGNFEVYLLNEWLYDKMPDMPTTSSHEYVLLGHCTEKTALPESETQWRELFEKAGLRCRALPVGCCGMAGTFGHETVHKDTSKAIYGLSWQPAIAGAESEHVMATGYSCRSQVKRLEGFKPRHPVQVLLHHLS